MKKRLLTAAMSVALVFTLGTQAMAASVPSVKLDGTVIQMDATPTVIDRTTYVSYWPIVKALYPDATAVWENDRAVVRASGLNMTLQPGTSYLQANGRYLYLEEGILVQNGILMVPVRVLARALGANVNWNSGTGTVELTAGSGPITSGDQYYDSDTVYWLSHIINAESGNQPMTGKIAVGNVVMNRVNSSMFPNTAEAVIKQKNQFTPVANGSIKLTPNEDSVIAAKLCLDGANTAGTALYFVNPRSSPNSWASRNRPYVATIGAHAFFA